MKNARIVGVKMSREMIYHVFLNVEFDGGSGLVWVDWL